MRTYLLLAITAGLLLGVGCGPAYVSTGYSAGYSATYVAAPEMAYVSPGVQVVAGYDEPIFYSDNFYWRYHNNRWYSSRFYNRGWVYATPPRAVLSIDRPYRYRNYRGTYRAGYRAGPAPRTYVRDHRGPRVYSPARGTRVYSPPRGAVRTNVRGNVRTVRPAPYRATTRPAVRTAPVRRDLRNAPRERRSIRDHRR